MRRLGSAGAKIPPVVAPDGDRSCKWAKELPREGWVEKVWNLDARGDDWAPFGAAWVDGRGETSRLAVQWKRPTVMFEQAVVCQEVEAAVVMYRRMHQHYKAQLQADKVVPFAVLCLQRGYTDEALHAYQLLLQPPAPAAGPSGRGVFPSHYDALVVAALRCGAPAAAGRFLRHMLAAGHHPGDEVLRAASPADMKHLERALRAHGLQVTQVPPG